MKCYGTHSCGHEGMIELYGPRSQREWREKKYFEDECPECIQKRRDEESKIAAARAAEMGLPALIGTVKQVAWAERIRMNFCDTYEKFLPTVNKEVDLDKVHSVVEYLLSREIYASFWIDSGVCNLSSFTNVIVQYEYKNRDKIRAQADVPPPGAPAPQEILRPTEVKNEGVAAVEVLQIGDKAWTITASFEKNDAFIGVMRKAHFEWDSAKRKWFRKIGVTNGPANDRAAELVSRLIKAGFCVVCENPDVRRLVESGEYQPEIRAWVCFEDAETITFRFDRDEAMNDRVRSIGGRWNGRGYAVPVNKYARIEEFARLYGFSITPNAQRILKAAREKVEGAIVVAPTVSIPLKPKDNPLTEILHSSRDVLPDLKDE